jgi:hypothetical protein
MVFQVAITEVVRKCRTAPKSHYGSQVKGLVLYGSVARDWWPDSPKVLGETVKCLGATRIPTFDPGKDLG